MSLLQPTQRDYDDAREGWESIGLYHETLAKLKQQNASDFQWNFEVVPGFFVQSESSTDDINFNYALENFGITKPWPELVERLLKLNAELSPNESYKLVFFARHGQGPHNVVIGKYGYDEWKRKWHALERDGDYVYAPDPPLTDLGIAQAIENNIVWKQQLAQGAPVPTRFYVSPLQRSSHTLVLTWKDLRPHESKVKVVENLREIIGFHLCNKRSSRTTILERFDSQGFFTEDGFAEEDELHDPIHEEEANDQCIRSNKFLQQLFNEADDQIVYTASHGGTIKSFLMILGHREYTIPTGGMIPVVIKATRSSL